MDQPSNKFALYIPRVALSSSSSSNKSSDRCKPKMAKYPTVNSEISETSGESESEGIYDSINNNYDVLGSSRNQKYFVHNAPKRESRSIQSSSSSSSTESNQSNYSINSLLLSVENLENFNKTTETRQKYQPDVFFKQNPNMVSHFYSLAYEGNKFPIHEYRSKMLQNITNISSNNISPIFSINPEKERDAISITSSNTTTNFTVVSLNDSHQRLTKSKKAICRRSQQITLLIMIMTILFIVLIAFMLILLDMRNQKMPR